MAVGRKGAALGKPQQSWHSVSGGGSADRVSSGESTAALFQGSLTSRHCTMDLFSKFILTVLEGMDMIVLLSERVGQRRRKLGLWALTAWSKSQVLRPSPSFVPSHTRMPGTKPLLAGSSHSASQAQFLKCP